jgi:replicative DNA helicase Mcm
MHEALEDQQVHVNKAGFNTHLRAQTSLLAAGNPKHGRFDPHEPIADQIDLGPTLLSRFDLMFMLEDNPDEERDREIADHKVRSRQIAGRKMRGESVEDEELETIKPAIPKEVMRAYIAHAKQTCFPTIDDDEVMEKLKDAFTTLRLSNGEDRDSPVPVTFRKLEAIQRLAEASARVRLSETVEEQDVERAMQLVGKSMRDVGMTDEGQFDADIVEAGQSKSQHERRKVVRSIIEELQEPGSPAAVADVKERASNEDIPPEKVNADIQHYMEKGEAYEPEAGFVRMT